MLAGGFRAAYACICLVVIGHLATALGSADPQAVGAFLFVGEVAPLGWLIWCGARDRTHTVAEAGASTRIG